jgi:hypothetical protein
LHLEYRQRANCREGFALGRSSQIGYRALCCWRRVFVSADGTTIIDSPMDALFKLGDLPELRPAA